MSKTSIDKIVSREIERLSAYLRADKKSELTVDLYARSIEQMLREIGKAPDQLTPEDMQKFKAYMAKRYSENGMYALLVGVNQYTERILNRPDLKIRPPRRVDIAKIPLTENEVRAIRKTASERKTGLRDVALVDVMYYGGLRVAEVSQLTLSSLDLDMNRLRVNAGKGKNYDMVNLTPEAVQSLREYIERGRPQSAPEMNDRLFLSREGGHLIMTQIRRITKQIAFEAGISKNVHPHIFRHSMITHMAEKGLSASFIQAQSRHKSLDMVQRYTHLSQKSVRDAYDRAFNGDTPELAVPKPETPEPKPASGPVGPMYADGNLREKVLAKYLDGEIDDTKLEKMLVLIDHEQIVPRPIKESIVGYQ
jgi:site-specific recombinase XerD